MTGGSHRLVPQSTLLGKRVRINGTLAQGSAFLLNGLTGTVIAFHDIAPDWVIVRLDQNLVTPYSEWAIPENRLIALNHDTERENG
jgi:hypothetical protein